MVIDFDISAIDKIIEYANAYKVTEKMLYDIKLGKQKLPSECMVEKSDHSIQYYIEEQPINGWCHHIILTKAMALTEEQNYTLIQEVLNIFYIDITDVISIIPNAYNTPYLHIHAKYR